MQTMGIGVYTAACIVTHTPYETAALHYHIYIFGDIQFHSADEIGDFNLLVLSDDSFAEVQQNSSAMGSEESSAEHFAVIHILVATELGVAYDALPVFVDRDGTLQPLIAPLFVASENDIEPQAGGGNRTYVFGPRLVPEPAPVDKIPHVAQLKQGQRNKDTAEKDSSNHNCFVLFRLQNYNSISIPASVWDILYGFVTNGTHPFTYLSGIVFVAIRPSNCQTVVMVCTIICQSSRYSLIIMDNGKKDTIRVRLVSIGIVVLAIAVFKPFGLAAWRWEAYLHLVAIGMSGVVSCLLTELILKYLLRLPATADRGVDYIIHRNLWFQLINTPLVSFLLCLYRHLAMSALVEDNRLSWGNYFETLLIIAFCSFLIGLYWRFKFRSRYLSAELEETRMLNEQLQNLHNEAETADYAPNPEKEITLAGTTSEKITLNVTDMLYVESVGNYVKVCYICNGEIRTDMLRATSKQMEETLHEYPLVVRCHRAFLVNLRQVERIVSQNGNMQLVVKHCNDALPVSRSNMTSIKKAFKTL